MSGNRLGVRLVCEECMRPDESYFDVPLAWFVGKDVKIAFESDEFVPDDVMVENMWVVVTGTEGDRLVGVLMSEPLFLTHVQRGDRVELERTQIMAVVPPREVAADYTAPALTHATLLEARCNLWN